MLIEADLDSTVHNQPRIPVTVPSSQTNMPIVTLLLSVRVVKAFLDLLLNPAGKLMLDQDCHVDIYINFGHLFHLTDLHYIMVSNLQNLLEEAVSPVIKAAKKIQDNFLMSSIKLLAQPN